MLLGGCAIINVSSPPPSPPPSTPPAATTPTPQTDTRSIPQLRQENQDLRVRLAKAERDHNLWLAAIDRRKSDLKAIERDCDRAKDDMKHYKKLAEKKDKD